MKEPDLGRAVPTIPALDAIRGYGAVAVVVIHAFFAAGSPSLGGDGLRHFVSGFHVVVDLFFVMSGFVMFLPLTLSEGEVRDRRAYVIRRLTRVLPAYLATLLIYLLLAMSIMPAYAASAQPLAIGVYVLFLQGFVALLAATPSAIAHLWSIGIEAAFYVALPWLGPRFWRRPWFGLTAAFAIGLVWRAIGGALPQLVAALDRPDLLGPFASALYLQLPNYLAHFAAGMVGARFYARFADSSMRDGWPIAIVQLLALAGIGVSSWWAGPSWFSGRVFPNLSETLHVAAIGGVFVWSSALARSRLTRWLSNRFSLWLGQISYPLYLTHLFFIHPWLEVIQPGSNRAFVYFLLLSLPPSMLCAWLIDRHVEWPIRSWGRRIARDRSPVEGSVAGALAISRSRSARRASHRGSAFFVACMLFYLAFTPGTLRGQSNNDAIVATTIQIVDALRAWILGLPIPAIAWPRHGAIEALLGLPFALLGRLFEGGADFAIALQPISATALIATLVLACARRFSGSERAALAIALTTATATMLWPFAYVGFETSQSLCLLVAAWIALGREPGHPKLEAATLLASSGLVLSFKESGPGLLPAMVFLVAGYLRRDLPTASTARIVVVTLAAALALLLPMARAASSDILAGLRDGAVGDPYVWLLQCLAFFTSGSKSLFLYAPITLLGAASLARAHARNPRWAVFTALVIAGLVGSLACSATWTNETWGPHDLHAAIAPLAICIAVAWPGFTLAERAWRRRALVATAVLGCWISFLGAGFYYGTLHVVATQIGENRLVTLQHDPWWNHVRFNARLLGIWIDGRVGTQSVSARWPLPHREWWFAPPPGAPASTDVDLTAVAVPQGLWARSFAPGGSPLPAILSLAALLSAAAIVLVLWRRTDRRDEREASGLIPLAVDRLRE